MVATPTSRPFDPLYTASMIYLYKPEGMGWSYIEGQPVDIGRGILVDAAIKSKVYTHIFFVDSDATLHPATLLRLMERNVDMVTACIYRRNIHATPTFGRYNGVNRDDHHTYDFGQAIDAIRRIGKKHGLHKAETLAQEDVLPKTDDDLMEIDGCGLHCCLIKLTVFEKMTWPYFSCSGPGSGEDFDFCRKVREAGFKIYADLSVHSGHIAGPGFVIGLKTFMELYGGRSSPALKERAIWDVGINV